MTDSVFNVPAWWRLLGAATRPAARLFLPERAGPWPESEHPTIWLHAASLGETKGLLRLAAALDGVALTLTATTHSGLRRLRDERPDLDSFLLPWDDASTLDAFLSTRRVVRAVFFEADAWPAAFGRLSARSIPFAMASVRCGARSRARWKRLGRILPGMTESVSIAWADGPAARLDGLGFRSCRGGASLKWAGVHVSRVVVVPGRVAAISFHLRDLPRLRSLVRANPGKAWLWFPRRRLLTAPARVFARFLGLRPTLPDALPSSNEVWIASRLGLVRSMLPGCEAAWVSPGHDREEPLRLGVPVLLDDTSSSEPGASPEETLREIVDWLLPN